MLVVVAVAIVAAPAPGVPPEVGALADVDAIDRALREPVGSPGLAPGCVLGVLSPPLGVEEPPSAALAVEGITDRRLAVVSRASMT